MLKKAITFSSLLLLSSAVFSQTVDQLKKENQKLKSEAESNKLVINDLKAKVDFCNSIDKNKDVVVKSFTDFYDVKVLKCKGNKGEQSVTVEILITQNKVNQSFKISTYQSKAVDNIGNVYSTDGKFVVGGQISFEIVVPTDTPIKATLKFINILPGTSMFKLISFNSDSKNLNGGQGFVDGIIEIRNLNIEW